MEASKANMKWLNISVICLILSVLKCSGMSVSELEEFSNFLTQTSRLDEILKKGTSPDEDYDEDEPASDHAWEESGKFEGDLILNDRQRRLLVEDVAEGLARNGLSDSTKRWPDNEVIYYIQREHFSGDQVDAIMNGIDDLAKASCVKFRPYRKGDRDAVVIQGSRRGCFSQVGYQGGYQVLNLSGRHPVGRGCFRHGTVVHELLHTLGFYHMQSSPDRDDYIDVKWENIVEPAKHNFRKYNTFSVSDFGVGYDYDSVLHYSRRAFSSNGRDTLVPKQSGASIGQRVGLSDKDAQKLNKMYCDADSDSHDAVQDSADKPIKKKKARNKPFEGHGIGYHQGKTVVIKLPAAQTFKLADTPSFHVFDHFSKTSKAVSPAVTEGPGAGEKIVFPYEYKPYTFNKEDFERPPSSQDKTRHSEEEPEYDYDHYYKGIPKSTDPTHKAETNKLNEGKYNKSQEIEKENSSKLNYDLNDAFERLGAIIKTHVYPSQTPDFDAYRDVDYSKYYNPEKIYEPEPEIVKVDKAFASSPISHYEGNDKTQNQKQIMNVTEQDKTENNSDIKAEKENEEELKDEENSAEVLSTKSPYITENVYKDFDASYGTTDALEKMPKIKEENFITPEYATLKHLANKHDYSSFYDPKAKNLPRNQKHSLFGYIVPLYGNLLNKKDFEDDNKKYDSESYVYSGDKSNENALVASSKLTQFKPENEKGRSIFGRVPSGNNAYSLFGVLVPLTHKWYKVNYDPVQKSLVLEDPVSSEDYR